MKFKAVLTVSAIYQGVVGLGMMLAPGRLVSRFGVEQRTEPGHHRGDELPEDDTQLPRVG